MKKLLLLALLLAYINTIAQEIGTDVKSSAGKTFKNESYSLDWTLGELSIQSYQYDWYTTTYFLNEGFHQTAQIKNSDKQTNGFLNVKKDNLVYRTYPNPVSDWLTIEFENDNKNIYIIKILDITGNTVIKTELCSKRHQINMQKLNSGLYFINIYNNQEVISTSKITKIN